MMEKVTKCLDYLEKVLRVILGILMGAMVAIIFMQVVLRYGFASATSWADEFARYCMIWIVYLASPLGFRHYRHIRVDVVVRRLPEKARKVVDFLMYILQIVFLVVLIVAGLIYTSTVAGVRSTGLNLDMRFMYSASIIGGALMIIFILECIYNEFIKPRKEEVKAE